MIASTFRSWFGLGARSPRGEAADAGGTLFLHGKSDFAIALRGVSRCQGALQGIVASRALAKARQDCIATLVGDDSSSGERDGVAVVIEGQRIGYLPRHVAIQYREWLHTWRLAACEVRCRGVIVCWSGAERAGPRYSVRLDLEVPFKMTALTF